jgi:uncharacterized cupin superfamily protein
MRKSYPLRNWARESGGECILGMRVFKTHACYIIYGELAPSEEGRKICPGSGHEEILMVIQGDLQLSEGDDPSLLREGEAIHLQEEETVYLANWGSQKAVYVLAGGHSGKAH